MVYVFEFPLPLVQCEALVYSRLVVFLAEPSRFGCRLYVASVIGKFFEIFMAAHYPFDWFCSHLISLVGIKTHLCIIRDFVSSVNNNFFGKGGDSSRF
jgi:hypothetical protein